jgi:drug/metabolite transporter (DMT)-like permease
MFYLALTAAAVCAICNGVAAILQKISASKAKQAQSLDVGLLWQLIHNPLYSGGLLLDLAAGGAELFSVRFLPLFLVQSIIAAGVAVTALIDRIVLKHHMSMKTYGAVGLVLAGLILLAITAQPTPVPHVAAAVRWGVVIAPIPMLLIGWFLVRRDSPQTNVGLALLSGLAFGGTSVVGRVIALKGDPFAIIFQPLAWSLAAYGGLGILLFTLAVQRGSATIMNAALVSTQTVAPTIVGLWILGDGAHGTTLAAVIVGCAVTLTGTFIIMNTHRG